MPNITKLLKLITIALKVCLLIFFTENQELHVTITDLYAKNLKLERKYTDVCDELKKVKEDIGTLMEINDAFGTENEELKRRIKAFESGSNVSKRFKTKGKKVMHNNDDEDSDDNLMDFDLNATEELAEEPNEKAARVC